MNAVVPLHSESIPLRGKAVHVTNEFVYTDDGRLIVAHGHELEQSVMAYKEDLRRKGKTFRVETCTLEDLRRFAETKARAADPNAVIRASPERQEQVKDVFRAAVKASASDIHWIGNEAQNICRVLFRVHGLLEPHEASRGQPFVVDEGIGAELRSAAYTGMSDVADPMFRPNIPQDARIAEEYVRELGLYGARVATTPLDKGQLMVCRLLHHQRDDLTLEKLGYLPEQIKLYSEASDNKRGMIIVAGETGSGKSTTLALSMSMLIAKNKGQIHVLTLEDPPEYYIAGANQKPVKDGDFAGAIRNALRLDPDVIMIQEMRDLPSAQAAFRAALTGHGVRTTLHANGPFSILTRLADLGLERWQYTDSSQVRCLMHQALTPVLCEQCRIKWDDLSKADWLEPVRDDQRSRIERYVDCSNVFIRNPNGCSNPGCHKGHTGRTVVARIVKTTPALMKTYINEGPMAANEYWIREEQGITHAEHLRRLIASGSVDPLIGEHMVCKLTDTYD